MVQAKQETISKITRERRAGGMTQAVEHLPGKFKALSSNPSTTKKEKKKNLKSATLAD
jgi:hypothetical protein